MASCGGGGGGGGGGGSSSSSGAKPCSVANGKGELNGTVCAVTACNGGYDNGDKLGLCLETLMGYFSPPDSKERNKCPETAPDNAILVTTDTWGISLKHECWTCKEGFIKDTNGDCVFPEKGKYIDPEGTRKECSPVENGTFVKNTAAVTLPTGCDFTCNDGYRENTDDRTCDKLVGSQPKRPQVCAAANGEGREFWSGTAYGTTCKVVSCNPGYYDKAGTCTKTERGYYSFSAPARSIAQRAKRSGKKRLECLKPANSIPVTAVGLSDPHSCYKCKPGYVKRMRGKGACVLPHRKLYVNTSGEIAKCTRPKGKGFASFIKNASGKVGTPDACDFNCKQGFKKNAEFRTCDKQDVVAKLPKTRKLHKSCSVPNAKKGRETWDGSKYGTCEVIACKPGYVKKNNTCALPDQGKYSDGDVELSCHVVGGQGGTFLANTGAVSTNKGCSFSCATGLSKDESGYACNPPEPGKYVDSTGTPKNCTPITIANGASATWLKGAAGSAVTSCPFSCSTGFVKSARSCVPPSSGNYVNASGAEASCSAVDQDQGGFKRFEDNTGAVSTDTGCNFSCNVGFVQSSYACRFPTEGKYVDSGTQKDCTPITLAVGASATWLAGAADSLTSCPFSCSTGFLTSGRSCSFPSSGNYVNASGAEDSCSSVTDDGGGFHRFEDNTGGVSTNTGCNFSCNVGFVQSSYACRFPTEGKYMDSGTQKDCTPITLAVGASATWLAGAADSLTSCPFSCSTGFLTSGRSCSFPSSGNYVNASGAEDSCSSVTDDGGGFHRFEDNTGGVSTNTGCNFSCNAGFVKGSYACRFPTEGKYMDSGTQKDCTPITLAVGASATWLAGATASPTTCRFSCNSGFLQSGRSCVFSSKGNYVNSSGAEASCSPVDQDQGGFKRFENNTGAVSTNKGCNFSCNAGFVKGSYACRFPTEGKYMDSGTQKDCTPITLAVGASATWLAGAADSLTSCPFSCSTGFVKSARTCVFPSKGHYVKASGVEDSCSSVTEDLGGFHRFEDNTGGVSTNTGCNFSCNPGFVKDSYACSFPTEGEYVDSTGTQKSCTPLVDRTNVDGWIQGAADAANKCPFSCLKNQVADLQNRNCGVSCPVQNGNGQLQSGGSCKVVSCNSGFDNSQDSTQCAQTLANFYSLANDKIRISCPTPSNSAPTSNTGLSSPLTCYTCTSGYLKIKQGDGSCDVPQPGKYVDILNKEQDCTGITGAATGFHEWVAGPASDDASCDFSCNAGYTKNALAGECNIPSDGKYADSNGDEQSCSGVTGASNSFNEFLSNTVAVSTAKGCDFSCNAGFVKNTNDYTCKIPNDGMYADNGVAKSCYVVGGAANSFLNFLPNTGAVSAPKGCGFSCKSGFAKNTNNYACNIPSSGTYANALGVEVACDPIGGNSNGFNEFLLNTGAISSAAGCDFSCNAGYLKSGRDCNFPGKGTYVDTSNTEKSCSGVVGETGGFLDWSVGPASTAVSCPFTCNAGYIADFPGNACNYPAPGYYVNAQGSEADCDSIVTTLFDAWSTATGPVDSQDACPFTCQGEYSPVEGECKNVQKAIALSLRDEDSYVLLENGELQRWGNGSATPAKVDLGTTGGQENFAQAVSAGYDHVCVILKNANLNHGPMRCWGVNSNGKLGVGDTSNRSTPTAVTALGSKTAKSVASGGSHTCVIQNDDTVKCWGDSAMGVIGGTTDKWGDPITGDIGMGTNGAPLGATTALRIASGDEHSCAVLTDGSVKCWGMDDDGQSDGGTPSLGTGKTATEIAVGEEHSCAILDDGSVKCWGSSSLIGTSGVPSLGTGKTAHAIVIGVMGQHTCTILDDKTVKCWGGENDLGEIGGGYGGGSNVVAGSSGNPLSGQKATLIAVGIEHSCAILASDNSLKCWGSNTDKQAANGAIAYFEGSLECPDGYITNTTDQTCDIPGKKKFVDASGTLQSCDNVGGTGVFNDFEENTRGVDNAKGCNFSCASGYVKDRASYECNIPSDGKYADAAGLEIDCAPIVGDLGGFNVFLSNSGAVSTDTGCGFSCNAGYVYNVTNRACDYPTPSKYVESDATTQIDCTDITSITHFNAWAAGPAADADSCPFLCATGYIQNRVNASCDIPSQGTYADASSAEQPCSDIEGDDGGFSTFTPNTIAMSTADGCGFSCNSGYIKDDSLRECKYPVLGEYVDNGGNIGTCTNLNDSLFTMWRPGPADSADACHFSCRSGYLPWGRMCAKSLQPIALSLDHTRSFALLESGEVYTWGDGSATPSKADLGVANGKNNTPMAFSSYEAETSDQFYHRCIILKNANADHGPMMCWGSNLLRRHNDYSRLGRSDPSLSKGIPGKVDLGTDSNSNEYTAKSMALGVLHTCAIRNDDTVKCFGDREYGQIGGTATRNISYKKRGNRGDPLEGETTLAVASGEDHVCAIAKADKSVKCWGENGGNQADAPNIAATEISLGNGHSCAVLDNGSVRCWGYDNYGQTGGGTPRLGAGKTAEAIAAGRYYTCALLTNDTVKCWGRNNYGQRGGGQTRTGRIVSGTSKNPLNSNTATLIGAGTNHACAVLTLDNALTCWGRNDDKQAADGLSLRFIEAALPMKLGSDGTGPSTGSSAPLSASSTPTATEPEEDADGKICKITVSDGTLTSPWTAVEYTTPLTYNTAGSTSISDAIDNLIAAIGATNTWAGATVTLSNDLQSGNNLLSASVDLPTFDGMNLNIHHDDDTEDCSTPVVTSIALSGGSGGTHAEGLWVIKNAFTGSGDSVIALDYADIDLGSSALTKEAIADKVITEIGGGSWAGKQYKDLPYTVKKLDGLTDSFDACPDNDFCVVFTRVFTGTEGNNPFPFLDADYAH